MLAMPQLGAQPDARVSKCSLCVLLLFQMACNLGLQIVIDKVDLRSAFDSVGLLQGWQAMFKFGMPVILRAAMTADMVEETPPPPPEFTCPECNFVFADSPALSTHTPCAEAWRPPNSGRSHPWSYVLWVLGVVWVSLQILQTCCPNSTMH